MPRKYKLKDNKKQCTICKQWKELSEFVKAINTTTGKAAGCKVCVNSLKREMYHNDPEFLDKFKKQRKKSKLKKYGLSLEDYYELLDSHRNRCKICNIEFDDSHCNGVARVDHDHKTGKVRGLLCTSCNVGLGNFKDNIEYLTSAIAYLKENK